MFPLSSVRLCLCFQLSEPTPNTLPVSFPSLTQCTRYSSLSFVCLSGSAVSASIPLSASVSVSQGHLFPTYPIRLSVSTPTCIIPIHSPPYVSVCITLSVDPHAYIHAHTHTHTHPHTHTHTYTYTCLLYTSDAADE